MSGTRLKVAPVPPVNVTFDASELGMTQAVPDGVRRSPSLLTQASGPCAAQRPGVLAGPKKVEHHVHRFTMERRPRPPLHRRFVIDAPCVT